MCEASSLLSLMQAEPFAHCAHACARILANACRRWGLDGGGRVLVPSLRQAPGARYVAGLPPLVRAGGADHDRDTQRGARRA